MANQPLFPLGEPVITPGALDALAKAGQVPTQFLYRHMHGDWGEVGPEVAKENDLSVEEGGRILSAYRTKLEIKIWVITEADRSSTRALLPEEY